MRRLEEFMFNKEDATKMSLFDKVFDNNFNGLLNVLKSDKAWTVHENIDTLDFNNVSTVIAQRGSGANMISVWNRGTDEASPRWGTDFGVRIGSNLYNIPSISMVFNKARVKRYNGGRKIEYRLSFATLRDALQCAYTIKAYEDAYNAKQGTKEVATTESVIA